MPGERAQAGASNSQSGFGASRSPSPAGRQPPIAAEAKSAPSASDRLRSALLDTDDQSPIGAMFLSPRVVDQRTFEEFSQTLRKLMERATGEQAALESSIAKVRGLDTEATEAADRLTRRLEAAGKLTPGLDARIEKAEAVLNGAIDEQRLQALIEQRLSAIASGPIRDLESRIEQAMAKAEARAQAVEASLTRAIGDAESRTEAMRQSVQSLLHGEATDLLKLSERIEARLPEARAEIASVEHDARESAKALRDEITSLAEDAAGRVETIESRLSQRAEQIRHDMALATGPAITGLTALCRKASDLLGRDLKSDQTGEPAKAGSLGDLVDRAERAIERALEAEREADALRDLALGAAGTMREAIDSGAQRMDELESMREALDDALNASDHRVRTLGDQIADKRREIDEACRVLESDRLADALARLTALDEALERAGASEPALRDASDKSDELLKTLEKLQSRQRRVKGAVDEIDGSLTDLERRIDQAEVQAGVRIDELRSMVAEPLSEIGRDVQEVGSWLNTLIDRARETTEDVESKLGRLAEERSMVNTLSRRLEPWRELLEKTDDGGLPESLKKTLDTFRSSIDTELASALQQAGAAETRLTKVEQDLRRLDTIITARTKPPTPPVLPERRRFRRDDADGNSAR